MSDPAPRRREATLNALERLLERHGAATPETTAAALGAARNSALPLLSGNDPTPAYQTFVTQAISALVIEGTADLRGLPETLADVEELVGLTPTTIGLHVVGDPRLLALPHDVARDACLDLIRALGAARKISLWVGDPEVDVTSLQPGWDPASREHAEAIERRAELLNSVVADGALEMAPIVCWQRPCAYLVWIPAPGMEGTCRALVERAAAVLGPIFERASLTEGNIERSTALLKTTERRLTRLGFDLHDGALQDVALLAGELDATRRRLAEAFGGTQIGSDLLARLDDVAGIVSFLDDDLRELASTADSPTAARRPFDELAHGAVRAFSARTSIEPYVELDGDFAALTDSQRIALLRIVQESLTNVREHSGATEVRIVIRAQRSFVEAVIEDNGCGFVVEDTLRAAAKGGRMGLLGMMERVRLLGGDCNISSHPSIGTTISLTLARYVPGLVAPAEPARLDATQAQAS